MSKKSKDEEAKELATRGATALGEALDLTDEDYDQPTHVEPPKMAFIGVRNKELKDPSTGRTTREAGHFKLTDTTEPDAEDFDEVNLSILDVRKGRVYFPEGSPMTPGTQPDCRSNDGVNGSKPRDGDGRFGQCATCKLGNWGPNNEKPECREQRNFIAFDHDRNKVIIFTIGVAALKGWKQHDAYVRGLAAKMVKPGAQLIPFVHHLLKAKVGLQFKPDPAPHWVPLWYAPTPLPKDAQSLMREARRTARLMSSAQLEQAPVDDETGDGSSGDVEYASNPGPTDDDLPF